MQKIVQPKTTITCRASGFTKEETMPEESCQLFYECKNCKTILKPQKGNCCVFCSHGFVPCPPVQANKSCCN